MASFPHKFSADDVVIDSVETAFQGFFRLERITFRHPLFAGGMSQPTQREVFERGDAVVVLPYDARRDAVVLVEQIRIPALRTAANPWQLELVAGIVEAGESAADVAKRELMEESGLTALSLHKICSYLPSPGGCSERHTLYLAQVTVADERQVFGLASEQEDIRRHVVSRTEAMALLQAGSIDNAATVIGLQWLALNLAALPELAAE
ncbi:NUDIX domain-containing protein [uncultured Ferrimonas sp.]|uniref:NUDIX domain-containing protein n=1 Tax=uncultured Ferrimonas sp. TaxID=432640 RepID=UPI0026037697|nr:NUDIX domain-containing protein [uncultured Ferrimonas sp.]